MDNLKYVLYQYIEQIRLNPDKSRKIDLIFNNVSMPGQHKFMIILPYRGSLLICLNIHMTDLNIEWAERLLGVQLLDIPELGITILVFPTAINMNDTDYQRRVFVNIIVSYIERVRLLTRKIINRVDLVERSPNNNRIRLLHSHVFHTGEPIRPLTPPRRVF
jgi:hypothetical protein